MHSTTLSAAALLLAGLQVAKAQTFTDCNPLDKTTCPSDAALGSTQVTDWTTGASSDWTAEAGTTLSYGANGAEFTIDKATDAPTVGSNKYIFFGKVDAVVRAAPGTGIVSSFILESDDLDEIDWEWLGAKDSTVESNFFGKGNTTTYDRAVYHNVADPIGTFHTYTIDWTSDYIKWSIDGNLLRTLDYADALALGGKNFPQTPMKIKMGNWVGCANAAANQPSSATYGTCQWAGGPADFSQAVTMYVQKVTIQDYSCGSEYTYGDTSGSYQSIKISGSCNGKAVASSGSASSSVSSSSGSATSGAVFAQQSSGSSSVASSSSGTGSSSVTTATTMSTSSGTGAATKSTATSASSSKSSSSPATTSSSSATTNTPKSKYGAIDVAVIALGLTLGYFVM